MDKSKQKKEYASYNPAIIKKIREKYGVTTQFINASLRGDRTSYCSLSICDDYKLIEKAVTKTINNL